MNNQLVTIIIPVYNVEQYLYKCLNSVINQTYKNLEIICVNDASTDNSLEILKEFVQKDNRIKIINQKNGGLSNARNTGIDNATGDYIMFLDSDDWCDIYTVEKLYKNIVENNTDFSVCASVLYDENTHQYLKDDYFSMLAFTCFLNQELTVDELGAKLFDFPVMAWGKLIRSDVIKKNEIKFIEGVAFEDNPFFFDLVFAVKNFSIICDELIFYRINRKGSDTASKGEKYMDFIKHYEYKKNKLVNENKFDGLKKYYWESTLNSFYNRLNQIEDSLKSRFYDAFCDFLKKNYSKGDDKLVDNFLNKMSLQNNINKRNTFLQNIFSIKNVGQFKVVTICGVKIRLERKGARLCKKS